ncbi:hypothetical protein HN358_01580 [Candidatus Uhrbacteria bacterium]|jgi:hypothetical protein|nr:hypothetical protein [Candidatus Uhrbacteria bacterium]MBT7717728.1 hypothetical protein [Candidatus Uhrbacteria bacterium]
MSERRQLVSVERAPDARDAAYADLHRVLDKCLEILESHSSNWFTRLYRTLLKERERIDLLPEDQKIFLSTQIDQIIDLFQSWARPNGKKRDQKLDSELVFSDMKERVHALESIFEIDREHVSSIELDSRGYDELAESHPEQIQLIEKDGDRILQFRENAEADWVEVQIPSMDNVYYKGGAPRIVMKIMSDSDPSLLGAEIPMNDIDILAWSDKGDESDVVKEALDLGADLEGIEVVDADKTMEETLEVRDVDLNQCLLGKDGVVFSRKAQEAANTGKIEIMDPIERGLWGSESYYYSEDSLKVVKGRGLYRLFKFVAEGKATSFSQLKINRQVNMGIYWLVLARKFSRKANSGQLLNRLYEIGKRAGQTDEGENDIYDVLHRVHDKYPFFTFSDEQQDTEDIVRWLSRKLKKLADRQFRSKHHVEPNQFHERFEGDDVEEVISLEGYVDDEKKDDEASANWNVYIDSITSKEKSQAA